MSSEFSPLDRLTRKRLSARSSRTSTSRLSTKEDDLTAARSKLDNILDSIARGEETFDDEYFDDETNGLTSPVKSKRPRGPRKNRKKARDDEYSKSSMFILKLFDRTVDLSEFCSKYIDSDPPLYPICRAWARNSDTSMDHGPLDQEDQSAINELESTGFGGQNGLYTLPDPNPLPVDENGIEIDLRIPKSISSSKKDPCNDEIDESINSMMNQPRESLLETNLTQWKMVREQWREAAAINQDRYRPSFNVIQALVSIPQE